MCAKSVKTQELDRNQHLKSAVVSTTCTVLLRENSQRAFLNAWHTKIEYWNYNQTVSDRELAFCFQLMHVCDSKNYSQTSLIQTPKGFTDVSVLQRQGMYNFWHLWDQRNCPQERSECRKLVTCKYKPYVNNHMF